MVYLKEIEKNFQNQRCEESRKGLIRSQSLLQIVFSKQFWVAENRLRNAYVWTSEQCMNS